MNKIVGLTALSLLASGSTALAAGLERNITGFGPLFEDGRYLEFSAAAVSPSLEGVDGTIPPGFAGPGAVPVVGNSGNLLDNYIYFGASYKADINDRWSYALILDQPYGAATDYPTGTSPSPVDARNVYGGSGADLDSYQLTGLLAYDATPRIKLYGGPVLQTIEADASISFLSYNVETNRSYGVGFAAGAAYEIPDIALRVALTYRSKVEHDFDTTETIGATTVASQTNVEMPQSVTLDFQTGIAEDTLIFGQVHWVDWSEFTIAPPNYPLLVSAGRPLVAYGDDWTTFTLGVGRRFNEKWAGSLAVTYEPQNNTELSPRQADASKNAK